MENIKPLVEMLEAKLRTINVNNKLTIGKDVAKTFTPLFYKMLLDNIRRLYGQTKNDISFSEGIKLSMTNTDEQILNAYINSKYLWDSYLNTTEAITTKINSILASNMAQGTFNPVQAKKDLLQEVPELIKSRVNTITRTEYSNIRKMSMEQTYNQIDPDGEFRYRWVGPKDYRTTPICVKISQRTQGGVSMNELKQIIKEEADPKTYTPDRPYMPHINCRHIYIKA